MRDASRRLQFFKNSAKSESNPYYQLSRSPGRFGGVLPGQAPRAEVRSRGDFPGARGTTARRGGIRLAVRGLQNAAVEPAFRLLPMNIRGLAVPADAVFVVGRLLFDFLFDQVQDSIPAVVGDVEVVLERDDGHERALLMILAL